MKSGSGALRARQLLSVCYKSGDKPQKRKSPALGEALKLLIYQLYLAPRDGLEPPTQ